MPYNSIVMSDWKLLIVVALVGVVVIFTNFYLFRFLKWWSLKVNKENEKK